MDKKKFEEIRAKLLEERKNRPKVEQKWPYELFGVECGEGWKGLYEPILDYAMEHNIEVHQVKEKFSGLRIYLASYDDTVRKMIDDAEEKSYHTCEICGKHIDKPITENHRTYPMCNECHEKRKKK